MTTATATRPKLRAALCALGEPHDPHEPVYGYDYDGWRDTVSYWAGRCPGVYQEAYMTPIEERAWREAAW